MNPYISIIVPVYKVERYLHKCIDSLLEQDLEDEEYEILLIDDGSPDTCGNICDEYSIISDKIRVFHKKNGGLSDARNYGVERAKGKYILFVDSDDYIKKNSLKRIVEECRRQQEPEVMFLQAHKVFGKKEIKYDDKMDVENLHRNKQEVLKYLSTRKMYPASAWSKMLSRDFLVKNNISFKIGQLSEDYEWSLQVYLKAETFGAYNGKYYYYVQRREGSITSNVGLKHFNDLLDIIDNMLEKAIEEKEYSYFIYNSAAYVFRCALWHAGDYYDRFENQIKKNVFLLNKRNSKDILLIRMSNKIFGIKATVMLLKKYKTLGR